MIDDTHFEYTISYDYDDEDEDRAWIAYSLMNLLCKLDIFIKDVKIRQNHVGDTTLTVRKRFPRTNPSAQTP